MRTLEARLEEIARTPTLLVASDFDGTLAPIVDDPSQARATPGALEAVAALAALPHTEVAVISGRALRQLRELTASAFGVHLVGSHGAEFEQGLAEELRGEQVELVRRLAVELRRIADETPGARVEEKPTGVALHYRECKEIAAARALTATMTGPAAWPGVHVRTGKQVVELHVTPVSKGQALETVRQRLGATGVAFIGDDLTDEEAFIRLSAQDVGIKVGPGESRAALRVEGPEAVVRLLRRLAELRERWAGAAPAGLEPIERHSLLSDQRTIALVTSRGRITWLCLPRMDSPAIFAELIGGPSAGYFDITPEGEEGAEPVSQSYDGDSFVLRTAWSRAVVTDYLDCAAGRAYQRAGRSDLVRVIEGEGRVRVTFAPRADFGRAVTALVQREEGLEVDGATDPVVLRSPGVAWRIVEEGRHQTAIAEVDLSAGPVVLELRGGTSGLRAVQIEEGERRRLTRQFWSGWAGTLKVPSLHAGQVRRSGLVLKALCYGPSGAIAAAGTSSLPESLGGVRNWDYRYCWPRDAAMSAAALLRLGNAGHAMKLLDWMLEVIDRLESPDRLRPIYTLTGRELGPEAEIGELCGYGGSRPVRIGNAAATQVQLDVFGPIADLVALMVERGVPVSPEHWRLVRAMVEAVQSRWQEPDHGIWEIRGPRKHHVHSKVMCWFTVERGLVVAEHHQGRVREDWVTLREAICEDVLSNGYKEAVGAFTSAYDDAEPDAAALAVGLTGLLPPGDERFLGTVKFVEKHLRDGPTVYRYRFDDGLPGKEGGFHLCMAWLIESMWLIGRRDEARRLLDELAALAGPTGMMAEQYDPGARQSLGNHPQAYSHLGLINAAVRLAGG